MREEERDFMWTTRKDSSNCVNIERQLVEDGKLVAYELCAYISLKDGTLNPVTGRKIPDAVLRRARSM